MAGELTALHKICQMLARNPRLPAEARAALAPLESLPPEAIPDTAVSAAVALAVQERPDLELDPENPKVARGSVADVFRFRDRTSEGNAIAFKTVRADSLLRIQNEAAILMRMAKDCPAVGVVAGPNFAAALAEALRDAAGALLREIDFVGEAANLRDARAFYKFNRRIRVPATIGIPLDRGIFMEFVEGVPLLEAPLDYESRRDAARLVFRRLVLDPLFSGLPESIFHADPHAGNLMVQTQKHAPLTLVLLDWSQAGRLSAPLRHALIALCLYCVTGDEPSPDVLTRLLESNRKSIRIPLPQGTGDPLHAAFEIVQQLALQGHPVPLNLLLLRKSFLTLDGITRQLDPDFNVWRETLAYASGVFAGEAVVRIWSIQFPTGPISIVPGCPRERSRLISRARSRNSLCICTKLIDAFPEICAMFHAGSSGITRSDRGGIQMNFTILIKLLPLLAFTYFVVLPVSLAYIVEWTIHYWLSLTETKLKVISSMVPTTFSTSTTSPRAIG